MVGRTRASTPGPFNQCKTVFDDMRTFFAIFFVFVAFFAMVQAVPYNKYGRTCKDILCTVREECVMQRDECTAFSDKCGTYPTCKRKPGISKTGCAAMKCPTGHFCSIRQENCDKPPCQIKPTCIAFRTPSPNRVSNVPDVTESFAFTPSTTQTSLTSSYLNKCKTDTLDVPESYNRPSYQSENRFSYNSPFNRNSWSFDRISGR